MKKNKIILLILTFILLLNIAACSRKPQQKPSTYQKKEKAAKSLTQISKDIDSIMKNLETISQTAVMPEKPEEQKNQGMSSQQGGQQGGQQSGQKTNQAGGQGSPKTKTKEMTKGEKIQKLWDDIDKKVKDIHTQWNSYEAEALKKGATPDSFSKLKNSLNGLTVAVENRDHENIINLGSQMYLNLSPFFDLYKDEIGGSIGRIKYSVYQAFLVAEKGDKLKADEFLTQAETNISNMRQKLGTDKKKVAMLDKLNFALQDMKSSLQLDSSSLLKIKRDIILKNIEELEK